MLNEKLVNPFKMYDKRKFKILVSVVFLFLFVLVLNLITVISIYADELTVDDPFKTLDLKDVEPGWNYVCINDPQDIPRCYVFKTSSPIRYDNEYKHSFGGFSSDTECFSYYLVNGKWLFSDGGTLAANTYEGVCQYDCIKFVKYSSCDILDTNSNVVFQNAPLEPQALVKGGVTTKQIIKMMTTPLVFLMGLVALLIISVVAFRKGWTLLVRALKGA